MWSFRAMDSLERIPRFGPTLRPLRTIRRRAIAEDSVRKCVSLRYTRTLLSSSAPEFKPIAQRHFESVS